MNYKIILTDKGLGVIDAPEYNKKTCYGKGFCCDWNVRCEALKYEEDLQLAINNIVLFKDKELVYAALANNGLNDDQLKNETLAFIISEINTEYFESVFIKKDKLYPIPEAYDLKKEKICHQTGLACGFPCNGIDNCKEYLTLILK